METLICSTCKQELPIENFSKSTKSKTGYSGQCKQCLKDKRVIYQDKNKVKIKEYTKQHYKDNSVKLIEYQKQYKKDNPERTKEYIVKYRIEHKEELKEYGKEYKCKNKERTKQRYMDNIVENRKNVRNIMTVIRTEERNIKNNGDMTIWKNVECIVKPEEQKKDNYQLR